MPPRHVSGPGGHEPPSEGEALALSRRAALLGGLALALGPFSARAAPAPVKFGFTPVFMVSDKELVAAVGAYLSRRVEERVSCITRRTYQEITALLLSDQLGAAWICGYPYVQHRDRLALLAVPVWQGKPLYQSYLIVEADSDAGTVADLRGHIHAFSDPDSNSGFLVTQHQLATMGEKPSSFFRHTFFTYGHRNVVRAVASGLAQSGSVDGYVWEVMREIEPHYVEGTRVIRKSERLGFPPVVCPRAVYNTQLAGAITDALITMDQDELGREILAILRLDGFTRAEPGLFDGIAEKYRFVKNFA